MSNSKKGKKILVAALDWGLGHATRLIPIIKILEQEGFEILLASSGGALQYWLKEMPYLPYVVLPAYNPHYHRNGSMAWAMLLQSPKFLSTIYQEHEALKKIVVQHQIDGIISDNRYGLFHPHIPSVIITHQLFIQTSQSLSFLQPVINTINFSFLKKFNRCWIPDVSGEKNISGLLSHQKNAPDNVAYIGLLSRIKKVNVDNKYRFLLLISGPEPQRSIVEELLWQQLQYVNEAVCFVRGTNTKSKFVKSSRNIDVFDVVKTEALNILLAQSETVICRSGYSTIMDLLQLNKQAILIPTPGQTEQEYLASYLEEKKLFTQVKQNDISTTNFLMIRPLAYQWQNEEGLLEQAIKEFTIYL